MGGKGLNEIGLDRDSGKVIVKVDQAYFRPTEVGSLLGDSSKAKKLLKWEHKTNFDDLVREMVEHDLRIAKQEALNQTSK